MVWQTNPTTTVLPISFGPASLPVVSGSNIVVSYCFYGSNMPSLGTLSFQLTNPETNTVWGICSFDATCTSNCTVLANPSLLPVLFGYFDANETNNAVQLKWATEQEMNVKGFDIERSTDDSSFTSIGFVVSSNPQGFSDAQTAYVYKDDVLPAGVATASYRIREEDIDGRYTYSPVQSIRPDKKNTAVRIWATDRQVNILFNDNSANGKGRIAVYDERGRMVAGKNTGASRQYCIGGLPAGGSIYYVHIIDSGRSLSYAKAIYVP
jgi:hypothetical protein